LFWPKNKELNMKLTVKDFSDKSGVSYAVVAGVFKLGVTAGVIQEVEKRKTASGKGKPSIVYEVPDVVTFDLKNMMDHPVVMDDDTLATAA
jgi:hypothetical protein